MSPDGTEAPIPVRSVDWGYQLVNVSPPSTVQLDELVTVPDPAEETVVYLQLCWVRRFGEQTVRRSASSTWIGATCEGEWQIGCILCREPDEYSPQCPNLQEACEPAPATCTDQGAPIMSGFNRRSRVGPFSVPGG